MDIVGTLTNRGTIHEYSNNLINGNIEGDGLQLTQFIISPDNLTINQPSFIESGTVNAEAH